MPSAHPDRKITYWTGWLSPEMEGTSKEVFKLKDHFARSMIVGLSRHYWGKASLRQRYLGLNFRFYPFFRLIAPLLEMRSSLNHIYGSINEWHFLRSLGRRPTILSVAVFAKPLERSLYAKVRLFIAHSSKTAEELVRWGADPDRVRVLYPGLDLDRHAAIAPRGGSKFKILFATAPPDIEGIRSRGVDLILDVAAAMPDVEFILVWRPWGDSLEAVKQRIKEKNLKNVVLHCGLIADMRSEFAGADAVIAPFLDTKDMKVCPTSLIESLAYGRPVLATTSVGIADLIQSEGCGEAVEPAVPVVCAAIERMRERYDSYARNARRCAERHFNLKSCLRQHEDLYEEVLQSIH